MVADYYDNDLGLIVVVSLHLVITNESRRGSQRKWINQLGKKYNCITKVWIFLYQSILLFPSSRLCLHHHQQQKLQIYKKKDYNYESSFINR
jgi:hypothetical protein